MTAVTTQQEKPLPEAWEKVLVQGELQHLNAEQRAKYYMRVCESLDLNHLTKPMDYITLNGRLTLYMKKDGTDQLRTKRNISIKIVSREKIDELYVVTAQAWNPAGRTDEAIGAVSIKNLHGNDLANALMKCETKAKRRVTLSISGLGWMDETEIEDIKPVPPVQVVQGAAPDYLPDISPQVTAATFVANLKGVPGAMEVLREAVKKYNSSPGWKTYAAQIEGLVGAELYHSDIPETELFPFETDTFDVK